MTATIQLSRDTHVYIAPAGSTAVYWKIPVLDGYSFSQSTATTEVTLNEMQDASGNSNRGRSMFTNALEPAEWSFSTYARPVFESSAQTAVEEVLWAYFLGANTWDATNKEWDQGTNTNVVVNTRGTTAATTLVLDANDSDRTELGTFDLYFVLGGCAPGADESAYSEAAGQTIYKVAGCVVNTAGVDFDIDGITTINWSGFGSAVTQVAAGTALDFNTNSNATLGRAGVLATNNFLRNRIASLTVQPDTDTDQVFGEAVDLNPDGISGDEFLASYNLILTGGSINLENNITFLTPEELCRVNTPIGHITGTRNISGSFTCYLNDDNTGTDNRSARFFKDLSTTTTLTRNKFNLKFTIGDITAATGVGLAFEFPSAHIDIPTHQIEDVISLETNFHALPSSITNADEVKITYKGVAP
tara:strand:+ start:6018 stop:7268 length:1251 start_codon:yes stop_codon:yes gene_type:complete